MRALLACTALVLAASDAWSQGTSLGYYQSSVDGRVFEVRTRGDLGLDLYDVDGTLQTAMERRKPADDFKGVTYTLASSCPKSSGKIETTDVNADRISMRVELPNSSMADDLKGGKGAKTMRCFMMGLVKWQRFALVRTTAPARPSDVPAAASPAPRGTQPFPDASGAQKAARQQDDSPPARVVEARGFSLTVDACRRSGASVNCKLTLTNKDALRDTQLIAGSSRFITVGNRTYPSSEVVLAGVRNRQYSQATLLQGLPADGEVIFENVPATVEEIHLLEVSMWARDAAWFTVQYPGVISIRD